MSSPDTPKTVPVTQVPNYILGDDATLMLTRGVRQDILRDCLKDGLPAENKDKRLVMELLAQIDESTLTSKKLASDDANADKNLEAAKLVASMRESLGNTNIYAIPNATIVTPRPDINRLPKVQVIEGEMSTETSARTYSDFIAENTEVER